MRGEESGKLVLPVLCLVLGEPRQRDGDEFVDFVRIGEFQFAALPRTGDYVSLPGQEERTNHEVIRVFHYAERYPFEEPEWDIFKHPRPLVQVIVRLYR